MRILYNSKLLRHKDPFGTLVPGQACRLCVDIPVSVQTTSVECRLQSVDGEELTVNLPEKQVNGLYEHWSGSFSLPKPGLYFYYFYIAKPTGGFRLFRYGNDTNMEDGTRWQVSCVPGDFVTPDWARGATIYQIFPDRFCKAGSCNVENKLRPYTVHAQWDEEVSWQPTPDGRVLNNDFYGGNFRGITEKLPYIASLGVNLLYLNPISKSFSSHRYDTGDYKQPDEMLGTMEDFSCLCEKAHSLGMKVILDGVFSHTGANSRYFNREGAFDSLGAYQSKESPFYPWYRFHSYPDRYESWWGFDTLPTVNKLSPDFMEYIITGQDSVIAHWLKAGCDGFRLDVADELPNEFLRTLKTHLRKLRPDALLLGEVWEDASNKVAYDVHRRYFVDGELDSVMNYPFRTAILNLLKGVDDGHALEETVMTVAENYPPQVLLCNMNLLGSHDSQRILTALVDDFEGSREACAQRTLSEQDYALARRRLLAASFLQYALPGSPSIYYGDEAGMQGHKDPFNRRTYPWGREDKTLLDHYRRLGQLRKESLALRLGGIAFTHAAEGRVAFTRSWGGQRLRIYLNCGADTWEIPGGRVFLGEDFARTQEGLTLEPLGFCALEDSDGT